MWRPKEAAAEAIGHRSCAILTTEADASVADIHSRMPVILKAEACSRWLDSEIQDAAELLKILETGRVRVLAKHPVSNRVNRTANDSAGLIDPVTSADG